MVELAFHSLHHSPMLGGAQPLDRVVGAAAAAGFAAMGFDLPAVDAYRAKGGTVGELAAMLADHRMRCCDVTAFTATSGLDAVGAASELAELAVALGTDVCVAGVRDPMPWDVLCATFDAAAAVLSERGVRLAIECMPHTPLCSLAMAVRLCEVVGWDRAGLALDSFHFYQARTSVEELLALEAFQVAVVQCADAATVSPVDVADESRNHRLEPGRGVLPLAEWAAAVTEIGYRGPVVAEILAEDVRSTDPRPVALAAHRALARLWSSGTETARPRSGD